jgi:glycosyltransferase involved in cell wall biosynthesis
VSVDTRPRVLIVTDTPFSDFHGGGVTMRNLFSGWPAERLAMLYSQWSSMLQMPMQTDRCARISDFRIPGPGGHLDRLKHTVGLRPFWEHSPSARWHRRWFHDWQPDVVYSIFLDMNTFGYGDWLSEFLGVPHVCHITDDIDRGLAAFGVDRFRTRIAKAARRLAISEEMRRRYETLTGASFDVVHNGAEEFATPAAAVRRNGEIVIRYLGNVGVIQYGALVDVADAVRAANAGGVRCRLEIVGSYWEAAMDASFVDGTQVRRSIRPLPRDQWCDLLVSSDVLLVPATFASDTAIDVRLSLPTKLLECLSTGNPVLVYAPADSGPAAFCRRHGLASVIDTQDRDAIASYLRRVAETPESMRQQARSDQQVVRRDFSVNVIAGRFQQLLMDVARGAAAAA